MSTIAGSLKVTDLRALAVAWAVAGAGRGWLVASMWALGAVVSFHAAQWVWGGFILLYLYGLVRLAESSSGRRAFYLSIAVGYAVYAPHLWFLWTIFGLAAVVLWGILAVWLSLAVVLAAGIRRRWGLGWMLGLLPWLWLGLEYFRSELYYLRFSWLSVGYAFAPAPGVIGLTGLGVYGVPVFRLCSSGISQVIDGGGRVLVSGSYPGVGEIVVGEMVLSGRGRVPWDAWLGPMGVGVVVLGVGGLLWIGRKRIDE